MSLIKRLFDFFRRHKILSALFVAIMAYIGYRYFTAAKAETRYVLASVKKGTVISSVSGTGQVAAENQLDVKPIGSGMVVSVKVKSGDPVKSGQLLAVLDLRSASVSLAQARASVASAEANERKVLAGASGPDIDVGKAAVESAQVSLDNANRSLAQVKTQQDLLVKNALITLYNTGLAATPGPSNISSTPPTITGSYDGHIAAQYAIQVYQTTGGMRYMLSGFETAEGAVVTASPVALGTHGLFIQFPSTTIYDRETWTVDIPNTRASGYTSANNAYQAALQTREQAVTSAESSVRSAQAALDQAQASLAAKQAAARPEDIAIAHAQVDSAKAQLAAAANTYQNNLVRAPFDGVVGEVVAHVGDQASGATMIATLITKDTLAVVPFNEVDAAKLKLDQRATLTFDAIPDLTLTGNVQEIQTVGVATQGVVNYTVKISLDLEDSRVRPGMSVRASVVTDTRADVLTVPVGAIKSQGEQKYVEVLDPKSVQTVSSGTGTGEQVVSAKAPERVLVETGLSDDAATEITQGLAEGDQVIARTISPTAVSTAPSAGFRLPIGGGGGGRGLR